MTSTSLDVDVSVPVVVLNWNGHEDTIAAVSSLIEQRLLNRVILIDNCSERDDVRELFTRYADHSKVELILNESNLGFARAHNRIFQKLEKEGFDWVACLNNDAVATSDWLSSMMDCAIRNKAEMVASLMVMNSNNQRVDNAGHGMLTTGEIYPLGHGDAKKDWLVERQVLGACAGGCLYNLQMLKNVGWFDERFFVGYEDAELGLRAWLCGYDCIFSPSSIAVHKMGASLGKVRNQNYLIEIQTHIFYSWFKLMPSSVILRYLPTMLFKYFMVLVVDIVFIRLKFFKVMTSALLRTIREKPEIIRSRQKFHSSRVVKRSTKEIRKAMTPFFWFDLNRFWRFVVLHEKSNLEV